MDLGPGAEFAGYRIESMLGRGGMGVVFLAEHLALGRNVALKVLAPDLAGDARFRERFVRESRLAASLEHPNIVPIHEAGEVDGVLFIAMRYVEGIDLRALLDADGALQPERSAAIVGQVASALDAAHAHGLVHRDIKPGNILIAKAVASTADEHVYLSDFGLTKRTSSDSGLTGTGQFVGTLDYAAPEQFEGKPLDARTDVYSLGCLLYECLTGRPPFRRENDAAVMHGHLMEQAPAPSSLRPELPEGIDPVVSRAMAKKPDDRYGSAGAFAADARRQLTRADGAGTGGPVRGRGSRAVIAAGAVLVVIVVAVLVAMSIGGGETAGPTGQATTGPVEEAPLGSVVEIDPSTGVIVSTVTELDLDLPVGFGPAIAVGAGGVWVLDRSAVTHIDPESGTVVDRVPYPSAGRLGYMRAIDVGDDTVAITSLGASNFPVVGAISAIDPDTDQIRTFELPKVGLPDGLGGRRRSDLGDVPVLRLHPDPRLLLRMPTPPRRPPAARSRDVRGRGPIRHRRVHPLLVLLGRQPELRHRRRGGRHPVGRRHRHFHDPVRRSFDRRGIRADRDGGQRRAGRRRSFGLGARHVTWAPSRWSIRWRGSGRRSGWATTQPTWRAVSGPCGSPTSTVCCGGWTS